MDKILEIWDCLHIWKTEMMSYIVRSICYVCLIL